MKFISSILALSVLAFSTFANAGLIDRGCYQANDKKFGIYTVVVEVHDDAVTVNYRSWKHGSLGSYRGRIYSPDSLTVNRRIVSVDKITLNDGADGYINDAFIEITKDSVTFDSKNSKDGPQPRLVCNYHKDPIY